MKTMDDWWNVDFSLTACDVIDECVPRIDGRMTVLGTDIFDVLEKAREKLKIFGFDNITLHGATRCDSKEERT